MELSNVAMKIKSDIIDSYMKKEKYIPNKLDNEHVRYALYDRDKKLVFSHLEGQEYVNLEKSIYVKDIYDYNILTISDNRVPIKYIVLESCREFESKNRLKVYIIIVFILSAVFIGFIAYLLAKILLKPVREKVEHLNRFIKDSAHELNTPIAVLLTSVSMLKKGTKPDKMMRYIVSSSKQISQIYNDMHFSAFNERNEDVYENIDLKYLVNESIEYFNDISITKSVTIKGELEECFILMDRTKVQKVVNNLLSNAVKYSNKNSTVDVKIKDNILIIQDYGIGINKKEQKEIFKRYKRGNNIEGGFGIGLDIVKRVCKEYGLKIKLDSKINEGTIFTVDFNCVKIGAKCDIKDNKE